MKAEIGLTRVFERATGRNWVNAGWYSEDYEADPGYQVVKIGLEDLTADELAELMDNKLESANYHGSAGLHAYLAGVVKSQVGASAAARIMAQIYTEHGWLAEINGYSKYRVDKPINHH
jgi:hypothetical protein